MAGFIVGFDNDPEDIFERQIEFIRESAIPMAMVGMLNALPDTQLWKRLEREGRLLGSDATGNNTIATVNFIPKMDVDKLISGYQTIMRTIYKPSEYYRRALDSLQRVPTLEPLRGTKEHVGDLLVRRRYFRVTDINRRGGEVAEITDSADGVAPANGDGGRKKKCRFARA